MTHRTGAATRRLAAACALALTPILPGCADPPSLSTTARGTLVPAPFRLDGLLSPDSAGPGLRYSAASYSVAADVMRSAAALPYVPDSVRWGRRDHWEVADDRGGDCEDRVLWMRARLADRHGWPPARLLPTVCALPDGTAHAVLTVAFDEGDLFLDPLLPRAASGADLAVRGYAGCFRLDPATGMFVTLVLPDLTPASPRSRSAPSGPGGDLRPATGT